MTDSNSGSRSVTKMMEIDEDPTVYEPQEGDVLEWCSHIRIEVDHVTSDGKVAIKDVPPGKHDTATIYPAGERPDPDPTKHPPLGIETWATTNETVSVEDLQRLLRHGWALKPTR